MIRFNENTRTEFIGLFAIFICLWFLFYLIPEIFVTLFHTILGNVILVLAVILTGSYHVTYGILLAILFIILFRFSQLSLTEKFLVDKSLTDKSLVEGFHWTLESTRDFLLVQSTKNPNLIFDTNMIQNQASQEEVDYYLKYGRWPWSQTTKDLFLNATIHNPFVKVVPGAALEEAQAIYNEKAILMILSYQTKEGQFLIKGVQVPSQVGVNHEEELPSGFGDFPYSSGLKTELTKDVIRCNMDSNTLERVHYTGKEGIYGSQTSTTTPVNENELETIIPGFTFVNGPCNPCVAIQERAEYSCPFQLKVKDENKEPVMSSVWKTLWGV